jgi:hypothetical protein
MPAPSDRFVLRDLPLPTRLVIAAFLATVGAGYVAALVQVHFQAAAPGRLLPGVGDLERIYAGTGGPPQSRIERLLEAEGGPFNGTGSMRPAFTTRSRDWAELTRGPGAAELPRLRAEREGERLALLSWVRSGASRVAYERDDFPLGPDLAGHELTADLLVRDESAGRPAEPRRVRLRTLLERRCVDCHGPSGRVELARKFPLDGYDRLRPYCTPQADRRMGLPKLAQTTHAHLLTFALLYGATGLAFSLTGYPRAVRLVVAPLPLVAQAADVACWWLARLDPRFARAIAVTAALAGLGLAAQVLGGVWDLFGRRGRIVLVGLALAAGAAGLVAYLSVIDPYLRQERIAAGEER